jgi:predicted GNAT family acetyltransferase
MNIELTQDGPSKGRFVARSDDQQLGQMSFSRAGADMIIVDHTDVSDSARGTGVGQALFEHMVDWARRERVKIMPLCTFTRGMFERHPEARDVL